MFGFNLRQRQVGSLCTLIALCFAEAASRTDRSGGPYRYAVEAFGSPVEFEAAAVLRHKVSAAEPFVGRSNGSGLRGRNLPHEQREKGRDEEGQHDRSEYVGEGEHQGLSIGKVPSNALLQALVKRSTHHRGIAPAELDF
jgi:hypothetical protein